MILSSQRSSLIGAVVLAGAALLFGCAQHTGSNVPPTPLQIVAKAELDVATGVTAATKTTETLLSSQQISASDAQVIHDILVKITLANQQASDLTKALSTLDPTSSQKILGIITPVVQALQTALNSSLVNISNANAKAAINTALATVLTTLQIIESKVGG